MVRVATREAENPVREISSAFQELWQPEEFSWQRLQKSSTFIDTEHRDFPCRAKSSFQGRPSPLERRSHVRLFSMHQQGRFSLLGLGDIIMPGLVLCFVLRFESRKRLTHSYSNDSPWFIHRLTYFQCSLLGYCAGKRSNLSFEPIEPIRSQVYWQQPFPRKYSSVLSQRFCSLFHLH